MNFPCHPTRKYCLITARKVSKYGVFSSPYFPAFGLDAERYGVSLRIKSECGKIRSRKIPYLDAFHAVKKHTHHFNSLKITFHNITKVIMTYFHISVVVNDVEVISQKVPPLACSVSFENVLKNREKIFRADNLKRIKYREILSLFEMKSFILWINMKLLVILMLLATLVLEPNNKIHNCC